MFGPLVLRAFRENFMTDQELRTGGPSLPLAVAVTGSKPLAELGRPKPEFGTLADLSLSRVGVERPERPTELPLFRLKIAGNPPNPADLMDQMSLTRAR
jgi:hypothetical protein